MAFFWFLVMAMGFARVFLGFVGGFFLFLVGGFWGAFYRGGRFGVGLVEGLVCWFVGLFFDGYGGKGEGGGNGRGRGGGDKGLRMGMGMGMEMGIKGLAGGCFVLCSCGVEVGILEVC